MIRHVDFHRLRAAEPLEDALLQDAEQLHLDVARQVADLVEKQRRMVGRFEPADLPRHGIGERAALVAEQRALDERRRHRRAVHAHHLALAPRAHLVNRFGQDFLADPGFAEQEHGGRSGRDLLDLREDVGHRCAVGDDPARRPLRVEDRAAQVVFSRAIAQLLQFARAPAAARPGSPCGAAPD